MVVVENQREMLETLFDNGFSVGDIQRLCNSNLKPYAVRYNSNPAYRKAEKKRTNTWYHKNK